ncbi:hypothetical protein O181_043394 [Austropuccinia psidii MF-1]|uniref:Nudix hydrolase domain-containing protein n=1 Tax=Austropuccinia psidii MF-1 TaxID=1389203 RepID=A0A9Q3HID7_9BASI|nr:hypothetical protein [Austropuccinia psidii MF-1]
MTRGDHGDKLPLPRQVAVAVAFRITGDQSDIVQYLLVSSRKHANSWVLPKGGIEGEFELSNPGLCALREAWEEGGIKGRVVYPLVPLHKSVDPKSHRDARKSGTFVPKATYSFWLIKVTTEEAHGWPEEKERERRWVGKQEAIELVEWRNDGAVEALAKVKEQDLLIAAPTG